MTEITLKKTPKDIQNLTFEQAMSELEETVKRLESGQVSLDESVSVYTRGVELKNYCMFKLNEAESKIDKLIINKDGTIDITDFSY
jgi:exodeoxyribonuclease VII small subunit